MKSAFPTELSEQIALARELDRAQLVWFHVPNGGTRDVGEAARLRMSGVKAGVPDVVVLSPAPGAPRGAAVELKRIGGTLADVRPEQWEWLGRFEALGFRAVVAFGWQDARAQLRTMGYAV